MALTNPPSNDPVLYDGTSATAWDMGATSGHGVAWLAGLSTQPFILEFATASGTQARTDTLPFAAGAITFVVVDFPAP